MIRVPIHGIIHQDSNYMTRRGEELKSPIPVYEHKWVVRGDPGMSMY